jgi:hypothetical protein
MERGAWRERSGGMKRGAWREAKPSDNAARNAEHRRVPTQRGMASIAPYPEEIATLRIISHLPSAVAMAIADCIRAVMARRFDTGFRPAFHYASRRAHEAEVYYTHGRKAELNPNQKMGDWETLDIVKWSDDSDECCGCDYDLEESGGSNESGYSNESGGYSDDPNESGDSSESSYIIAYE